MKLKYIKSFAVATVLALSASCSSDYLETYPTDETSPNVLYKDTKGITMAVNGLAKIMVTQHISQGFNGEGTIKLYYGEYMGNNFRVDLPGWSNLINGNFYDNVTSVYDYYPWHYYYMLINNANPIIEKVDAAEGPSNEKMYLKAQAYSYRAYAYTMLAQIYGYRWDDSNNGEQKCLVLRNSTDLPVELGLSSLKDVYASIYSDLDKAISLFNESGYDRGGVNHFIDVSVAKAIYARAALAKKDYATAEKFAIEARAKAPLMDVAARKAFPALQSGATVAAYMQFKIKANDLPGVGNLNHFRSSEMYLIEAEAKHFLGNDSGAAAVLEELTAKSGRDVAYTCNKSGNELFKEIVKYRGIELWGEGFDWFDMKRWNIDIERKEGKADKNGMDMIGGGNYPASLAVKIPASAEHKWTWRTPSRETDYNSELK